MLARTVNRTLLFVPACSLPATRANFGVFISIIRPNALVSRSHMSQSFRIEKDSMGEVQVPQDAYYAAQTQRAVDNFPVSG
ncbi:MAG: hypothetical protein HN867_12690, partial [Deltaproteobacteria bacterium]|nr:hypothetical protein [Deltaproteobacteria bacterium]